MNTFFGQFFKSMCQKQKSILDAINSQTSLVLDCVEKLIKLFTNDQIQLISKCHVLQNVHLMQQILFQVESILSDEIAQIEGQYIVHTLFAKRSFQSILGIQKKEEKFKDQIFYEDSVSREVQNFKSDINMSSLSMIRGPYRSYTYQEKKQVLKLHQQGDNFAQISRKLKIPQKNIVRWCKNGANRKHGAGRKIGDIQMQKKVVTWIQKSHQIGKVVKNKQIRQMAKFYSNKHDFKSSKGWLKNFMRRYNLNQTYCIL